ncbi:MAG: hypothetical protein AAFQ41_16210 [Cyanobacteria bacterium J06623_7]
MKFLFSLALSVACLHNIGLPLALAQTDTPAPATPQPAIPLPLLQAAPLVQATSRLLGQQNYQIESEIELSTVVPDSLLSAQAQIETVIAAPNKVSTRITFFNQERALEQQYQIVGNGTQVWIYDRQENQYSVSEYPQFLESTDSLSVGILANFYLQTLNTVNNNRIASRAVAKLPPDRLVSYFQRFANVDLQNMVIRNEQIEGQTYAVYDIDAVDRSYEVTAYVSPQLANIERADLVGQLDGIEILMLEQIISQTIPTAIAPETFNFVPPEDAEQVESPIKINPFSGEL